MTMKAINIVLFVLAALAVISVSSFATQWQVIYQTDFSTDPGWTTDQSADFYWEPSTDTYFIHETNYPESYEPNRYSFVQVPYSGGAFRLEWDSEILRNDWSVGFNFGLMDSSLRYWYPPCGAAAVMAIDCWATRAIYGYQGDTNVQVNSWIASDLNIWYHNVMEYDPVAATVTWNAYVRGESTPCSIITVYDPPAITSAQCYLGTSEYPIGQPGNDGGIWLDAVEEVRIDNVVFSEPVPEPGTLALIAPALLAFAGIAAARRSAATRRK